MKVKNLPPLTTFDIRRIIGLYFVRTFARQVFATFTCCMLLENTEWSISDIYQREEGERDSAFLSRPISLSNNMKALLISPRNDVFIPMIPSFAPLHEKKFKQFPTSSCEIHRHPQQLLSYPPSCLLPPPLPPSASRHASRPNRDYSSRQRNYPSVTVVYSLP